MANLAHTTSRRVALVSAPLVAFGLPLAPVGATSTLPALCRAAERAVAAADRLPVADTDEADAAACAAWDEAFDAIQAAADAVAACMDGFRAKADLIVHLEHHGGVAHMWEGLAASLARDLLAVSAG